MNPTVNVPLTQEQLDIIFQSLDISIKSTGAQGAKAILPVLLYLENCINSSLQNLEIDK